MSKTYYGERENSTRQEELVRFYKQQKSTRSECEYGAKNCSTCKETDCKIRQFVENY